MGAATALLVALLAATAAEAARGRPRNRTHSRQDYIAERLAAAGRAVAAWTPCSGVSPWELSQLGEGDIMPSLDRMRTVVANQTLKWKNNSLPFIIEKSHFTEEQEEKIKAAVRELDKLSCLRLFLVQHASGPDFVRVTGRDTGCSSERIGRKGGEQYINLHPPNCLEPGTIAHEFMHAIGFYHTHNSPHRDEFIRILWENVIDGEKNTFFRKHGPEATDIGVRYDYNSLMHASRRAQSKNGIDTIDTYDSTVYIGKKQKPSVGDIFQLNKLYDCPYDVDEDDED